MPLIFILVNQEINKQPSAFSYISKPRVITVDKNPAYPVALQTLKKEKHIPEDRKIRQVRYLNNILDQNHRFIKKRVRSLLEFQSLKTATDKSADVISTCTSTFSSFSDTFSAFVGSYVT